MSNIGNRLTIFTGKGGVGKSALAMSYCQYLERKGLDARVVNFGEQILEYRYKECQIPYKICDEKESIRKYLKRIFKSDFIANLIISNTIFNSIFDLVPALHFLSFLGELYMDLQNEDKYYVLDAPASGHFLTFLDSVKTFGDIFKTGILFDDIKIIAEFLFKSPLVKVFLVSNVGPMIREESEELRKELSNRGLNSEVILNKSLEIYHNDFKAISKKISLFDKKMEEEKLFSQSSLGGGMKIPHFFENSEMEIISRIESCFEK